MIEYHGKYTVDENAMVTIGGAIVTNKDCTRYIPIVLQDPSKDYGMRVMIEKIQKGCQKFGN